MARQFVFVATLVVLIAVGMAITASASMAKPTRKLANMPQVFDFTSGIDLSADPPESASADAPSSGSDSGSGSDFGSDLGSGSGSGASSDGPSAASDIQADPSDSDATGDTATSKK
ncbi:uncharacterized protein LOC141678424 [Apium graveolens]|uniref:uncharacterized protein LOC141678424 n=1 Tax=Apium graveolens TaxID=4045 RepID=UPI003D790679